MDTHTVAQSTQRYLSLQRCGTPGTDTVWADFRTVLHTGSQTGKLIAVVLIHMQHPAGKPMAAERSSNCQGLGRGFGSKQVPGRPWL